MPFLDRSSAENLGQNRPLPITPMSPLSSESLQEEEEDVLHTQEGWKTDIPVIIASNRLPVRLIRLPVVDTSPSNNKSKKDTRKNKQQEENTNLMDDNNNNNNNYRRKWSIEWASDRIIEAQNSFSHHEISEKANIKWVGRLPDVDLLNEKEKEEVDQLLLQFNCYAVYVPKEEAKLYYEQYCKQTLWPTFHNIIDLYSPVDVTIDDDKDTNKPSHYWTPGSQKIAWQAYANVNQQFAHKICELYAPGDVIWIQDYHLLVTPSYIIRKIRGANVGLFLHVPFPSSEVFRTLSSRKELLRGMLNADHIGFHLFEYARHFMSSCKRILGLTYHPILRGQLGIDYGGRRVAVTCSHMAIDAKRVEETIASDIVREKIVELRRRYVGKKIVAGCDSIERLKGIPLKILAYDAFLTRCPEFIGKIVLVQKGIHRKGRITDYLQSKKEIEHVVKFVNEKYFALANNTHVIAYEEVEEFAFVDRIALWRVADIQLTTVLRDGLNTSPFEYIVAHKASAGVLILSEFSGSSHLLSGAITVNPWELDQLIDALRDATFMSIKEKEHRRDCDFLFVSSNPPRRWAKCVLSDIVNAKKKEDEFVYMGTGFGLDFRVMEVSAHFRKLTEQELAAPYQASKSRAIFLDYYRTLAPDVSKVIGIRWPDVPVAALSTLEHLCKDPRNTVFVVSGCHCELLQEKFGSVPGLGLVAEHGYFIRRAVLGKNARIVRPWERHGDAFQTETSTRQWREKAEKIIQLYVDRTNGSSLEIRKSAVLFRFAKSDFEFGSLQAAELKEHLEKTFERWPLNIIQGKDYIEVRPEGVGKGKVVAHILDKMKAEGNPADFVMCIGDDVADELMFEEVNSLVRKQELPREQVITCTVGQKPSSATFFVDDYSDVIALLQSLRVVSTKSNRNYSLSDMKSLLKTDNRPLISSSIQSAIYQRSSSGANTSGEPSQGFRRVSSGRFNGGNGGLTPVIEEEQSSTLDGASRYGSKRASLSGSQLMKLSWTIATRIVGWMRSKMEPLILVALFAGFVHLGQRKMERRRQQLLTYLVVCMGLRWYYHHYHKKHPKHS